MKIEMKKRGDKTTEFRKKWNRPHFINLLHFIIIKVMFVYAMLKPIYEISATALTVKICIFYKSLDIFTSLNAILIDKLNSFDKILAQKLETMPILCATHESIARQIYWFFCWCDEHTNVDGIFLVCSVLFGKAHVNSLLFLHKNGSHRNSGQNNRSIEYCKRERERTEPKLNK